jgi:hypothetical protein
VIKREGKKGREERKEGRKEEENISGLLTNVRHRT